MKKFLLIMSGLIVVAVLQADPAEADMCSPMNGPGGFFYPKIKACQPVIPGVRLPNIPVLSGPQNVPYPTFVPQLWPPAIP